MTILGIGSPCSSWELLLPFPVFHTITRKVAPVPPREGEKVCYKNASSSISIFQTTTGMAATVPPGEGGRTAVNEEPVVIKDFDDIFQYIGGWGPFQVCGRMFTFLLYVKVLALEISRLFFFI